MSTPTAARLIGEAERKQEALERWIRIIASGSQVVILDDLPAAEGAAQVPAPSGPQVDE